METLIIIFKYLALIVGIAFLLVSLYAIIAGTIKYIINEKKRKQAKEELNKNIDKFFSELEKEIEKEIEEEKSKKSVKKTKKSKKSE